MEFGRDFFEMGRESVDVGFFGTSRDSRETVGFEAE